MKICMFTNTYLPHVGGVARSVSTFAADLRQAGQQVLVVAPTYEGEINDPADESHVLRVPAIQHFNGSDFSVYLPLPGLVADKLREFKPDIIHSHHPFLLGDVALRAARRQDLPIVFTHHTRYEQYTHYVPFDSEPLKRFVINLSTEYANLCSRVIAPSDGIKQLLAQRGVTTPVTVLPTGIDLELLGGGNRERWRQRYGIAADTRVIGHLGRLAQEKNLPFLAEAAAAYLQKDRQAVFVVAGNGEAEQEIREIFATADLGERLIMPGIQQKDELADCYAAMDLFVFASRSETQGLVLAEAMAAGVPVVAMQATGVDDVVEEGGNGRILPATSTAAEFAAAIEEALSPANLAAWSRRARQTASGFSRQHCAAELLALYGELVTEKPPATGTDTLDGVRRKLKTEWELLQQKTAAVKHSLEEPPGE
ncbi:MAG: glycosyltransferase [Desulfurivibrio sp.]|nr:glycosyltransferase [Desulfurivibrio sp.]